MRRMTVQGEKGTVELTNKAHTPLTVQPILCGLQVPADYTKRKQKQLGASVRVRTLVKGQEQRARGRKNASSRPARLGTYKVKERLVLVPDRVGRVADSHV